MSHALEAHKKRARSIVASDTSSNCGTITVVEDDTGNGGNGDTGNGGNGDTGNGDGSDDSFLEKNGLWIAAGAVGAAGAVALGRR